MKLFFHSYFFNYQLIHNYFQLLYYTYIQLLHLSGVIELYVIAYCHMRSCFRGITNSNLTRVGSSSCFSWDRHEIKLYSPKAAFKSLSGTVKLNQAKNQLLLSKFLFVLFLVFASNNVPNIFFFLEIVHFSLSRKIIPLKTYSFLGEF